MKADRLAAERLQKKRHRAEETTEECAALLQSFIRTILCKVQPATVSCFKCHAGVAQVLCNGKG